MNSKDKDALAAAFVFAAAAPETEGQPTPLTSSQDWADRGAFFALLASLADSQGDHELRDVLLALSEGAKTLSGDQRPASETLETITD